MLTSVFMPSVWKREMGNAAGTGIHFQSGSSQKHDVLVCGVSERERSWCWRRTSSYSHHARVCQVPISCGQEWPFFPTRGENTSCVHCPYQKLTSNDRKRVDGRCTYKITPKFHSFFELSFYIDETSRNPRQLRWIQVPFLFLPNTLWKIRQSLTCFFPI